VAQSWRRRHADNKRSLPVFAGTLRHELQSRALRRTEFFSCDQVRLKIFRIGAAHTPSARKSTSAC
jgi:hypothetical protein